jgi:chaperonin GroEL (HSP60 family)
MLASVFRSCLKRLSSAKKNVSVEGVTEETIADALKRLMEKGENTSGPVYLEMGPKIIESCTFLVRCSQRLRHQSSTAYEGTSHVIEIYKNALITFFTKR